MTGWGDWAPNSGASKPANGATDNAGSSWGAPTPSAPAQNGSAAPAASGWPSAATNGAEPTVASTNTAATGGWGSLAADQPIAAAAPAQNGAGAWGSSGGANTGTGSWGEQQSNGAPPEPDIDAEEADKVRKEQDLEHEIKVTLSDKQADPNSPLYSVKTFEELNLSEPLKKGVYAMGFEKPSKIQERALPLLLENPPRNMIAQSQSGTGKTAAFVLAMLTRVDTSDPSLQAICLSPARELADQTLDVLKKMCVSAEGRATDALRGKFVDLKVFFAGKGSARGMGSIDAQIIVGTPGTIRDLIGKQKIKVTKIKMLVVDEADQMLDESEGDNSMGEQTTSIRLIISKMSQGTQFFPDYIARFAENFAPDANQIRLQPNELNVREIKQFFVDCPSEDSKYDTLMELYTLLTIGQSIIFTRTKDSARRLATMLRDQGHKVAELHSDLEFEQRDAQMREFRSGALKVMIATNVIARGLDVLSVNMVINYDLPTTQDRRADVETYLHRVGRTGRFGRRGVAINMVASMDTVDQMTDIERQLGIKLTRLDGSDYEKMDKVLRQTLKS